MCKCIHEGCKKQPNFNIEGSKNGKYCYLHKLDGMTNVTEKRKCIHEGCKKRPNFNIEGAKNGKYCNDHKLDGMINVKHKKCIHEGCKKQPVFNIEGSKIGKYCSEHKLDGMIDIKHKKCIHEGCKTHPAFNIEGSKIRKYCNDHKLVGMIDVKNKRCIHEGCKKQPVFNIEGSKNGKYCYLHKLDGMTNVISRKCKSAWCYTQPTKKYDGYCLFCYMNLFPDKPVARNYKTKERNIVEYIKSQYHNLNWIEDKIIQDGCSRRRPDLLIDFGYQIVIIEIDENQHTDYDCSCENKRLMEISQDLNHRPVIFIRFNPDDYKINNNKITSCWGLNKNGICVVKKQKINEWNERLNNLKSQIEYWLNNRTDKIIEIIQLFYDVE